MLPSPPASLEGFPSLHLPSAKLYRIHRAGRSPWWFASDAAGRFDLPADSGRGTCYLAEEPVGCFLEVFRFWTLVPEAELAARRLARLDLPPVLLADCSSGLCRELGLTAEIHSTPDYARTQAWAAALAAAGFDGIRYLLRHDPGQRLAGIALFGPGGVAERPFHPGEPIHFEVIAEAERRFGVRVTPTP
jgi:RES domain